MFRVWPTYFCIELLFHNLSRAQSTHQTPVEEKHVNLSPGAPLQHLQVEIKGVWGCFSRCQNLCASNFRFTTLRSHNQHTRTTTTPTYHPATALRRRATNPPSLGRCPPRPPPTVAPETCSQQLPGYLPQLLPRCPHTLPPRPPHGRARSQPSPLGGLGKPDVQGFPFYLPSGGWFI